LDCPAFGIVEHVEEGTLNPIQAAAVCSNPQRILVIHDQRQYVVRRQALSSKCARSAFAIDRKRPLHGPDDGVSIAVFSGATPAILPWKWAEIGFPAFPFVSGWFIRETPARLANSPAWLQVAPEFSGVGDGAEVVFVTNNPGQSAGEPHFSATMRRRLGIFVPPRRFDFSLPVTEQLPIVV
jgi:hypothetical protein